jgi:hypothetical protein
MAGQQAALKNGKTRRRILEVLRERPAALWEVARVLGVHDHTISGRFTELSKDLIIERTGERRNHPNSGCPADVWRICGAANAQGGQPDLAALLGYPLTLNIGGDLYDRQELLGGGANESYPGVPYARRADTGGQKLIVRVELAECPGCGHPLKFVPENGVKKLRCGTPSCNTTCEGAFVSEPGKTPVLALVMKTF